MSQHRFYEIIDADTMETMRVFTRKREAIQWLVDMCEDYDDCNVIFQSYHVPINREYMRRALEGLSYAQDLKDIQVLPEWWMS